MAERGAQGAILVHLDIKQKKEPANQQTLFSI
jgi:hypothetical protein